MGPELFVFMYVPSFIIFSLGFAHVNYITHSHDSNGNIEILNKNENIYYKFINMIGSGIYFHKNHHKNPRLMNPMYLQDRRATPVLVPVKKDYV
jgi:stearoyl-CoA desaturase (delta-9 desaturase)